MITIGGMIGVGKTTLAELLALEFNSKVFYESVDDNPLLPLFYNESRENIERYRYPFLLQLYFLNNRFNLIKNASTNSLNILDRSIYEDWYFAKINHELGKISEEEFMVYNSIFETMTSTLELFSSPMLDLFIYLKASFETIISHINKRGRTYEKDLGLIPYYRRLWEGYDEYVFKQYKHMSLLVIDIDLYDIVNSIADRGEIINKVKKIISYSIREKR